MPVFCALAFAAAIAAPAPSPVAPAPIEWLRPEGVEADVLPAARLPSGDPLRAKAEKLVANESATFIRRLIARSLAVAPPRPGEGRAIPVVLADGGNIARVGLALDGRPDPARPYIVLAATPKGLGPLFLHEGAHYMHFRALGGRRPEDPVEGFPHSLFAVTSRETALTEGYGIHFEALAGHFASAPETRAFYHRADPPFGSGLDVNAPFYFPALDLATYSQSWSRYQAVRDGLAAFEGPGGYVRAQLDPARDRSALRSPGRLVASEGVAASWLFWVAAKRAVAGGARPGAGLDQPALMAAELELASALRDACARAGTHATIVDVIQAYAARFPAHAALARATWLDLTKGGTADARMAARWRAFHDAALVVDGGAMGPAIAALEAARQAVALAPDGLFAALGPQLPVKAAGAGFEVLGERGELILDLNAASEAELALVPGLAAADRARLLAALAERPFQDLADLRARAGNAAATSFMAR